MLTNILEYRKAAGVYQDKRRELARQQIMKRCQELQFELARHPERAEQIIPAIEKHTAELAKLGG